MTAVKRSSGKAKSIRRTKVLHDNKELTFTEDINEKEHKEENRTRERLKFLGLQRRKSVLPFKVFTFDVL